MTVCYYITGHGFGHAIRTAQVLKALPPDVRLILRTTVPERLWREELPGRDFVYAPAEFDCGCLQSDSVTMQPRATLTRYREIAEQNQAHLSEEVAFLHRENVQCVVTDIPSFPLSAAYAAGIPRLAVSNFTWHDIYAEYAETSEDSALLQQMAEEYASATLALITPLATLTAADVFPHVQHVPLVARKGHSVRSELKQTLNISQPHIALLYLGPWGLTVNWQALAEWTDWHFLIYDPLPQAYPNVTVLDRRTWPYADIAASVDAVVSKTGYGTVTECIANSVPLIYIPRSDFAEHNALVAGMRPWGGGVEIAPEEFHAGRWGDALQSALVAPIQPDAYATNGAEVIAEQIMGFGINSQG